MPTRISLATGGTIVVPESPDEVTRLLRLESNAPLVTFHPTSAFINGVVVEEPEPVALRVEHCTMLADATPQVERRPAFDPETVRRIKRRLRGDV